MKKFLINTEDNAKLFGKINGANVYSFTITDGIISATVLNLGGILTNLIVPNNKGEYIDVVLGFNDITSYLNDTEYLGAIIGRVANCVENATFIMDGREYNLSKNCGKHSQHGGKSGFNSKIWTVEEFSKTSLTLSLFSESGDQGYPANLKVIAKYSVGGGALSLKITAVPDEKTPIALTFHPYFNLNGEFSGVIDNHSLYISSSKITKVDGEMVANGEVISTVNTPYDFSESKPIGTYSYDVNYLLNGELSAKAIGTNSGVVMEVYSNQKGLQFYTSNDLNAKGGKTRDYAPRFGFCLEPQNYPNAVNVKSFPSPFIEKDETYCWQAEYKFKTI